MCHVLAVLVWVPIHCLYSAVPVENERMFIMAEENDKLKLAEEQVKNKPSSARAWFQLGEAHAQLRHHSEAIQAYTKSAELDAKFMIAINQRGGERFKTGDIAGSIEDFEKYIKENPKAYDDHWRYGISLYYAKRFADGAKQFKAGEKAFGNDVENAFWHYLCTARDSDLKKARAALLKIGPDSRVPMMKVYDLISGTARPNEVLETVAKAQLDAQGKNEALFYAHLYIGLNYEAEGDQAKAKEHLEIAVTKHKIGHYMWDVGNVHLKLLKKK